MLDKLLDALELVRNLCHNKLPYSDIKGPLSLILCMGCAFAITVIKYITSLGQCKLLYCWEDEDEESCPRVPERWCASLKEAHAH
jgi:hypothetical protein